MRDAPGRKLVALSSRDGETLQTSLDRLRLEVEELRASRERLVLAADADRRSFERHLHDGIQQRLVGLAVKLQLVRRRVDCDPAAAGKLLAEMEHEVRDALDEVGRLAQLIYPPLLEQGALAAALRVAAGNAGVQIRIDATVDADCPAEIVGAVYFLCLDLIERAGKGAKATVALREEEGSLAFDIAASGGASAEMGSGSFVDRSQDRVEALGGRLAPRSETGPGIRVSGSFPLPR
jgi:signal transduction histidine kinase